MAEKSGSDTECITLKTVRLKTRIFNFILTDVHNDTWTLKKDDFVAGELGDER